MSVRAAIIAAAVKLAKPFEGWRARPYLCPARVWTQGYGSTKGVKPTNPPWSREHGEAVISEEMDTFAGALLAYSPNLKAQHPDVGGALLDFVFNLGPTAYKASTLRRKVAAEDWEEVEYQLQRWVFGGGRKLPGLVRRRKAEGDQIGAAIEAADAAPQGAAALNLKAELQRILETSQDPRTDLLALVERLNGQGAK